MKIQLILFRQRMIITIKLRKILVFMSLITLLRQQNDFDFYLGIRFQKNKTECTTLHLMLLS